MLKVLIVWRMQREEIVQYSRQFWQSSTAEEIGAISRCTTPVLI